MLTKDSMVNIYVILLYYKISSYNWHKKDIVTNRYGDLGEFYAYAYCSVV